MPSSYVNTRQLNSFQRFWRNMRTFRQKHPYWFTGGVGSLVTLPVSAAIIVMIVFPPATPAILAGAAVVVSHFGLAASISALTGAALGAACVVGGLCAGVRRGVAGIVSLFRKPLLVESTPLPGSKNDSTKIINKTMTDEEPRGESGVNLPGATGHKEALSRSSGPSRVTEESLSGVSETSAPPLEKTLEEYYEEAARAHAAMKADILKHFNEAIKFAKGIAVLPVCGDEVARKIAFNHNNAKTRVLTNLERMKVSFEKGELTSPSLRSAYSEMKLFVPAAWLPLPEKDVFSEVAHERLEKIHEELNEVKNILSSSSYQKFVKSIADIAVIDESIQGGKFRANAFKEWKPAQTTLREIKKSKEKREEVCRSIMEEDSERTSSLEEDRQARLEEVYRQFIPAPEAESLVSRRSRSFT